jgi:hypothetical protein
VIFEMMRNISKEISSAPKKVQHLSLLVLLIGLHSLFLGIFIFFFTELFYDLFFSAEIENFFFVRQAGLFLFCLGLFNLAILRDMKRYYYFVKVIIAAKSLAFLFLVSHAHLAVWPPIIYAAAVGDGLMALVLIFFYRRAGFITEKA